MENQLLYFEGIQTFLKDTKAKVQMCNSFQRAIELSNPLDDIFLPPGKHSIKFLDRLNDNGTVYGEFTVFLNFNILNHTICFRNR